MPVECQAENHCALRHGHLVINQQAHRMQVDAAVSTDMARRGQTNVHVCVVVLWIWIEVREGGSVS